MKKSQPACGVILAMVLLVTAWRAPAGISESTVVLNPDFFLGSDYVLSTSTLSGNGASLWVSLDPDDTVRPDGWTVGVGHAWYVMDFGNALDPVSILSATLFADNMGSPPGIIDNNLNNPFYLGFWLDATSSGIPEFGDEFGWVHLQRTGDTLSLLGSATETTGVGLFVGTLNAVPEPSVSWLIGIGALMLLRRPK